MDLSGSIDAAGEVSHPGVAGMEMRFYEAAKRHGAVSGIVFSRQMSLREVYGRRTLYLTTTIGEAMASLSGTVKLRDDFVAGIRRES
jgi:hypothetical protein